MYSLAIFPGNCLSRDAASPAVCAGPGPVSGVNSTMLPCHDAPLPRCPPLCLAPSCCPPLCVAPSWWHACVPHPSQAWAQGARVLLRMWGAMWARGQRAALGAWRCNLDQATPRLREGLGMGLGSGIKGAGSAPSLGCLLVLRPLPPTRAARCEGCCWRPSGTAPAQLGPCACWGGWRRVGGGGKCRQR